jgi:probable F420-dependent oxidoreductase
MTEPVTANPKPQGPVTNLAPPVDDLSAYIAGGRIKNAAEVIQQAIDAERIGYQRIWLSERYDLKEAGVLLGAMAARTSRLQLATGALIPSSRPPIVTAALGATLHSAFGPRLTLGLGRSMGAYISNSGIGTVTRAALLDYADIYRRLWRGEVVNSDGPAGRFEGLHMADRYDGTPPQIWAVHFGGPKACRMSASPLFDGVYLQPFLTLEAVANSIDEMRRECERIGRDFSTLRICLPLVSVAEMPDDEARLQMHARMVTYLGQPGMATVYERLNGWDRGPATRIRAHPMFSRDPDRIDHHFHRSELAEVAKMVPDEWMYSTSLAGSLADCVKTMAAYRGLGVDEISTYGTSPAQNAGLVNAWRQHAQDKAMEVCS